MTAPSSNEGGSFDLKHALNVAGRVDGFDAKLVALLHDAIEDGACTELDILEAFPDDICSAVAILTRVEREPYDAYIRRVRDSDNDLAIYVKLADLEANIARMDAEHSSLEARYRRADRILKGVL